MPKVRGAGEILRDAVVLEDGVYEGFWLNGKRHGTGKFAFNNGDHYVGQWRNDLMHGHGTYLYKDFGSFEGTYEIGQRHGVGLYNPSSGDSVEEEWIHGVLTSTGSACVFDSTGKAHVVEIANLKKQEGSIDQNHIDSSAETNPNFQTNNPLSTVSFPAQTEEVSVWQHEAEGVDSIARYFRAKRGYANFPPNSEMEALQIDRPYQPIPTNGPTAGVGIVFTISDENLVIVKSLVEGGAAGSSGQVLPGDHLINVDGLWDRKYISSDNNSDDALQILSPFVKGPVGTLVTMTFARRRLQKESTYTVVLMRGANVQIDHDTAKPDLIKARGRASMVKRRSSTQVLAALEFTSEGLLKTDGMDDEEVSSYESESETDSDEPPFWIVITVADNGRLITMANNTAVAKQDYDNVIKQLVLELSQLMDIPLDSVSNFEFSSTSEPSATRSSDSTNEYSSEVLDEDAAIASINTDKKRDLCSQVLFELKGVRKGNGWNPAIVREWQIKKVTELQDKVKLRLTSQYNLFLLKFSVAVRSVHEEERILEGSLLEEQWKSMSESKAIWSQRFLTKFGNPSIIAMNRQQKLELDARLKETEPVTAFEIERTTQFFVRKRLNALSDGDRLIIVDRGTRCLINETAESALQPAEAVKTQEKEASKGRSKATTKKSGIERKRLEFDQIKSVEDDFDDPTFLRITFEGIFQNDYELWFSSPRQKLLFVEILKSLLPRRCFWGIGAVNQNHAIGPSDWAKGLRASIKKSKGGTSTAASFMSRDGAGTSISDVNHIPSLSRANAIASHLRSTGRLPGLQYDRGGHPIAAPYQKPFLGNTEHPSADAHPQIPAGARTPGLSNQQAAYIKARREISVRFYGESVLTGEDIDDDRSQTQSIMPASIHDTRAPSEESFRHAAFSVMKPYRRTEPVPEYPNINHSHATNVQSFRSVNKIGNCQMTEAQVQEAVKSVYFEKAAVERYSEVCDEREAINSLKQILLRKHFTDKGLLYKSSSTVTKTHFHEIIDLETKKLLQRRHEDKLHKAQRNAS